MSGPGLQAARVADAAPPARLDDVSLFFDFDGTLVELAPTPDAVVVGEALLATLGALAARLPGRVAVVSGRSIAQLDDLLGAFVRGVAVAGSHGAERRAPGAVAVETARSEALGHAIAELAAFAEAHGLLAEHKTLGLAIHYRQCPDKEGAALDAAAAIAAHHGVVLQRGKMMVELRAEGDKGQALAAFLASPAMAGTRPLFFGDDVTDEEGFAAAARAGGAGVLVGDPRPTAARYRLAGVAAVTAWIEAVLEGMA